MSDKCILCGVELNNDNKSIEHFPPKNFIKRIQKLNQDLEEVYISIKDNSCKYCNNNGGNIEAIFNLDLFSFCFSSKELLLIEEIKQDFMDIEEDILKILEIYKRQQGGNFNGDIISILNNYPKLTIQSIGNLMESHIQSKDFMHNYYSFLRYEYEVENKNIIHIRNLRVEFVRSQLFYCILDKIIGLPNISFFTIISIKENFLSSSLFIYKLIRVIDDLFPKLLEENSIFINVSQKYKIFNEFNGKLNNLVDSKDIFNIYQKGQKVFALSRKANNTCKNTTLVGRVKIYENGIELLFYGFKNNPIYGFSILNEDNGNHLLSFKYYKDEKEYFFDKHYQFKTKAKFSKPSQCREEYISSYNYRTLLKKADIRL